MEKSIRYIGKRYDTGVLGVGLLPLPSVPEAPILLSNLHMLRFDTKL
jgi:hypothetical protein